MEELLLVSSSYDRLPREQDLLSESQDSVIQSLYTEELDPPRLSPSSGRSSEPSVIFSFLFRDVFLPKSGPTCFLFYSLPFCILC